MRIVLLVAILFVLVVFTLLGVILVIREVALITIFLAKHSSLVVAKMVNFVKFGFRTALSVVLKSVAAAVMISRSFLFVVRRTASLVETAVENATSVRRGRSFDELQRSRIDPEATTSPTLFSIGRGVIGTWVAPTFLLAVFVGMSGVFDKQWKRVVSERNLTFLNLPQSWSGLSQHAIVPVVNMKVTPPPATDLVIIPPEWTSERDTTATGDVRRMVITSQLWSTEDEALAELRPKVAAILRADFDQRHRGILDPVGSKALSEERIVNVAVKNQYLERIEKDFGTFTAPMNRLWWQIEVSPVVRTELYSDWKTARTRNRVFALGLGLSFITLLATNASLISKLKTGSIARSMRAYGIGAFCVGTWLAASLGFVSQIRY